MHYLFIDTTKMKNNIVNRDYMNIKNLIYTIRGQQVMLDSDLAKLYQTSTTRLNEQVKRNRNRFPEDFMFQLNKAEYQILISQFATPSSNNNYGGRRTLPYAFTEQGIAMLSSVLKSEIAVKVSVSIIRTFVEMRKFLATNHELFSKIATLELNQEKYQKSTDERFMKIEEALNHLSNNEEISQKIFFDGQLYDAFSLLVKIIKKAKKHIILIDNYIDTTTLDILSKRQEKLKIDIYTSKTSTCNQTDIKKFNAQYWGLTMHYTRAFHDRFLIIDENICYHIWASIKDVWNKIFWINKIEDKETIKNLLKRIYTSKE